jgi:HSP20 family protein
MASNRIQRSAFATPLLTFAREVDQLQHSINQMFQDPLAITNDQFPVARATGWYPAVEFVEGDKEFTMTAELPGVDEKDVHVELDGDLLTVRGEKRSERVEGDKKKDFYLEERTYGSFRRSFTLPPNVDRNGISAAYSNGVLTLKLPKTTSATPQVREIAIGTK